MRHLRLLKVITMANHGNRDTFVTMLSEGSWSSYLGSIFLVQVECYSTIYCYRNNVAMATDKCLSDCATRWATKLFLTESCVEIIASRASCSTFIHKDKWIVARCLVPCFLEDKCLRLCLH